MMNQQLANQISAATSAKQAQLRAIQQGMQNRNKNKPVSTVEPFQRQAAVAAAAAQAAAAVQAAVASTANDNGQVKVVFFSESMMHFSHCPKNVPKTILKKRF